MDGGIINYVPPTGSPTSQSYCMILTGRQAGRASKYREHEILLLCILVSYDTYDIG